MMPSADGKGYCAACGNYFPLTAMDIVAYGTGYRCLRCSEAVGAAEQAVVAIDSAREREATANLRGRWGVIGWFLSLLE